MDFKAEPDRTGLLVIDMTNEFLKEGSPLEVPAGRKMVPRLKRVIETCRSEDVPVIYTRHVLREDGTNAGLFGEFYQAVRDKKAHVQGSEGVEIYDEIFPEKDDIVISKHRYSAFYETDLDTVLKNMGIDTLIISGVLTNLCCESTARDAMFRDYRVIFLRDCNATFDLPDFGFGEVSKEEIQKSVCSTIAFGIGSVKASETVIEELKNR
ncbi:isochorismatase [candidate division MSBL1 archaeon SCGC-AAA259E17]|uniref:Isochorismatase n=1 Tax=candidate division MSBL1 archaeon SCGC-AAA259E17 TaxID=1698263 RepID=A0A133UDZ6_9EURY|nr:isochorismatase [candidate division MSBL1 archaeon SCGC-AAA259E17]